MKCPFKKIITHKTIRDNLHETIEKFNSCDKFECVAYYEIGMANEPLTPRCKRLEMENNK